MAIELVFTEKWNDGFIRGGEYYVLCHACHQPILEPSKANVDTYGKEYIALHKKCAHTYTRMTGRHFDWWTDLSDVIVALAKQLPADDLADVVKYAKAHRHAVKA